MGRTGALAARWMTMRCRVTPSLAGSVNADNRPARGYGTPVEDVPCRLTEMDEQTVVSQALAGAVTFDKKLLVEGTMALNPFDRVDNVSRPDPESPGDYMLFDVGPFVVRRVLQHEDDVVQLKTAYLSRTG